MLDFFNAVWYELKSRLAYVCKESLKSLPTVFAIAIPFIAIWCTIDYYNTFQQWSWEVFLVPLPLLFILFLIRIVRSVTVYERYGIPLARKKFTKRGERGEVIFSTEDIIEMAEYIATVEEYCEKKGLYRSIESVAIALIISTTLCTIDLVSCQAAETSMSSSEQSEYTCVANSLTDEEIYSLQQIALAEAENQGEVGMMCVMQVILNRVASDAFPNTVVEVITQQNQFSSYENGSYITKVPNSCSTHAYSLLATASNKGALYFENPGNQTDTWHSCNLEYVFTYKDHIFYK